MLMKRKFQESAYTFVEVMLMIFAFFIVLAISVPILTELKDMRLKKRILKNIRLLEYYSESYFEKNNTASVTLYELVGPKKVIPELKYIDREVYPETLYQGEVIQVETERFGLLSLED